MRSAFRFSLLVFAGLALIQTAWIVTVPPFRGIDEFDHVFRAVGVADGQWRLSVDTPEGRGLLVEVPSDVVEAASPQCDALGYTEPDNCFPVEELPTGRVTISTAAATYHPVYYFVIGSTGQFFEGAGVVYAMRATSALISALGVACAAFCLVLAGGGRWARFGFLASLTPVLVYTSTLPAPNSMEIVAGLCLWTALVGFLRDRGDPRHEQLLLVVATIAACVLVTVRLLGPMWLGLIVLTAVLWAGWTNVRAALLRRWSMLLAASLVVLFVLVAGAWWSRPPVNSRHRRTRSRPGPSTTTWAGNPSRGSCRSSQHFHFEMTSRPRPCTRRTHSRRGAVDRWPARFAARKRLVLLGAAAVVIASADRADSGYRAVAGCDLAGPLRATFRGGTDLAVWEGARRRRVRTARGCTATCHGMCALGRRARDGHRARPPCRARTTGFGGRPLVARSPCCPGGSRDRCWLADVDGCSRSFRPACSTRESGEGGERRNRTARKVSVHAADRCW